MVKSISNKVYSDYIKVGFTILFLFLFNLNIYAQTYSDTVHIPEITILEKYTPDITGLKIQAIDSATLQQHADENITSILSSNSSVFIKSYGAGKTASSAFRGAGANHTQLLWNGININSSMLGQADLNKLPVFFIDHISVYHGGAALSNNSGAFGGSINVVNKPDWSKKMNIDFMQAAGSFNTYGSFFKSGFGNTKFQSVTRLSYNYSDNNYPYKISNGSENLLNNHAQYNHAAFMQEIYFRPDNNNIISTVVWMQRNESNLPGNPASEKQKSEIGRTFAEWSHQHGKWRVLTRAAYIQNYMNYTNSNANIDSRNQEINALANADAKLFLNEKLNIISGINLSFTKVNTNNYDAVRSRNQLSVSAGINGNILKQKLNYLILLKQEFSNNIIIPIIPSIGLEFAADKKKNILVKANISKNYHMPSMNDLYWNPGGNSNLKPEDGYFAETGVSYQWKTKNEKQKSMFDLAIFYSNISNNIVWVPGENPNIWIAQNLKEVTSKGIEAHSEYSGEIASIKFTYACNYTYTSAINQKTSLSSDNSAGKQLIYVPYHTLNSNFKISWSKFYANYNFIYTGIRYISTDNLWYMPPYMLSDLSVGTLLKFNNYTIILQGTAANLMNVNYQVVAANPMMKRNFRIVLKINFNK